MKIRININCVLGKMGFRDDECKFFTSKNGYIFSSDGSKIEMPAYKWKYLIEEYLGDKGFQNRFDKSKIKIQEIEKANEVNMFSKCSIIVDLEGWFIPEIQFIGEE